jgi:integrase
MGKMRTMYLGKQHRKWWAYHDIPPSLKPAFGGLKRLAANLQTEDEKLARRRADILWLHDWSKQIAAARSGKIEDEASFYRRILREAGSDEEREAIKDLIADEASDRAIKALSKAGFSDWPRDEEQEAIAETLPDYVEARRFEALATGAITPFLDNLEDWLGLLQNEEKTKGQKRGTLNLFAKEFPYVEDVKPEKVQRWFNNRARDEDLTRKTLKRVQSELTGYWKYLRSLGLAPKGSSPFADLEIHGADSTRWVPFRPSEVVALRDAAITRGDHTLADLITLAMWTGARIESICSLKVAAVHGDYIRIEGDKTDAGTREVPVHSRLMPTLQRLCDQSSDGFVLSGLPTSKYEDRSDAIGKRFGRLKTALGFGKKHVFHSIRKTVTTILENAGIPENVTADIVGHEKPRITYGLYSGGTEMRVKRKAIELLEYPEAG